MGFIMFITTIY